MENKLNKAINKYKDIITVAEYKMLNTLLRYNLLLEFKEVYAENGSKRLVGYNLEREIIFIKIIGGIRKCGLEVRVKQN